jgi:Zn-dependent peptidase ImmA (M78 family)
LPYLEVEAIEAHASELVQRHGMVEIPIDVVALAVHEGLSVNLARFDDETIAGQIIRGEDGKTSIYARKTDPTNRIRFTVAHELGHHVLGHLERRPAIVDKESMLYRQLSNPGETTDPVRREEFQANLFAAGLLMPRESVKQAWQARRSVQDLARMFRVSQQAMQIRINQLDLW